MRNFFCISFCTWVPSSGLGLPSSGNTRSECCRNVASGLRAAVPSYRTPGTWYFSQFPGSVPQYSGNPIPDSGHRFLEPGNVAPGQFIPVSGSHGWQVSSLSTLVTTVAASATGSASVASSGWVPPYGVSRFQSSPYGPGPCPFEQGFTQFGFPQANPYGFSPWGMPLAWQSSGPRFPYWGGLPLEPRVPRRPEAKHSRPTTDVAPASSVPTQASTSPPSLRVEVLKILGPVVCPPTKSALREPQSSALQQRLLQSVEEISSDRSFPEGNLVSSCLSHIQGTRSGLFYDDLPAGDAALSIGSTLAVSHIGL